jgi:hypothetical protein
MIADARMIRIVVHDEQLDEGEAAPDLRTMEL